jgi:hypothetical protein
MSDVARKRTLRLPVAGGWAAAVLLLTLLFAVEAGGQSTTPQRKNAPGPRGKLAGQVLDEDGKPAAKASVYCQSSDGRSPRATKTDDHGHFKLTCPSGPVDVRATAGELSSEWIRNVRVRTGETTPLTVHIRASPDSKQEKKPSTPQK